MKNERRGTISEYGSVHQIRFANTYLYDSEGDIVYCKCGVPAETAMIGAEAYLARCNKCMGYEDSLTKLVYRSPNETSAHK